MAKWPGDCTQLYAPSCMESTNEPCVGCGFQRTEAEIRRAMIHNGGLVWKDGVYRLILKGRKQE